MKTLFALVVLAVLGTVASFLCIFALNLAGLPGALLAGKPGVRSMGRFRMGTLVASLGQSYVYLAFVAFIVNWTLLATQREDVTAWPLWPVAFCAVIYPIWKTLIRARLEDRETEFANPQVEGLHLTVLIVFLSFFVFAFLPIVMRVGWGWIPYMMK